MQAVATYKALPCEEPRALVDLELPDPTPGDRDLLIRVEAVSVNPADYRMRLRKADDGQAAVLGWDVAGTVEQVGKRAETSFAPGDRVFYSGDLNRQGANCELHAVDARIVGHRPLTLSAAQAAALPLTALTAWEALFERIGIVRIDEGAVRTMLILGGAGGVGSMAVQLAKTVPGLRVLATASSPESQAWCRRLGADEVLDHSQDLRGQLVSIGLTEVEYVLILSHPDEHFDAVSELLAPHGTICCVVPFNQPTDLNRLMRKSARFAWEFMFTRPMFHTSDLIKQSSILNEIARMVDTGLLVSTMSEDMGFICAANLRRAHARLEQGHTLGKLVLTSAWR